MLYRISAPHYVAGLIVQNGIVKEAAPILGWCCFKEWSFCEKYFKKKNYTIEQL
jgi:hypothetical protein